MVWVFNQVPPEGSRRSQAFSVGFWVCRLLEVISADTRNLLIILRIVDDDITKFLTIARWETPFINGWTKWLTQTFTKWWNLHHPFLWTTQTLCFFYTQSWHSPVFEWAGSLTEFYKRVLFFILLIFLNFPRLLMAMCQLFFAGITFKISKYLQ